MAARKKKSGYAALRPHAARILRLAEYPTHVNGAYLDDPTHIPLLDRAKRDERV
jgi:alpha-D-ribose 1-methylphosphonate 5-phosphate C-P lyase